MLQDREDKMAPKKIKNIQNIQKLQMSAVGFAKPTIGCCSFSLALKFQIIFTVD